MPRRRWLIGSLTVENALIIGAIASFFLLRGPEWSTAGKLVGLTLVWLASKRLASLKSSRYAFRRLLGPQAIALIVAAYSIVEYNRFIVAAIPARPLYLDALIWIFAAVLPWLSGRRAHLAVATAVLIAIVPPISVATVGGYLSTNIGAVGVLIGVVWMAARLNRRRLGLIRSVGWQGALLLVFPVLYQVLQILHGWQGITSRIDYAAGLLLFLSAAFLSALSIGAHSRDQRAAFLYLGMFAILMAALGAAAGLEMGAMFYVGANANTLSIFWSTLPFLGFLSGTNRIAGAAVGGLAAMLLFLATDSRAAAGATMGAIGLIAALYLLRRRSIPFAMSMVLFWLAMTIGGALIAKFLIIDSGQLSNQYRWLLWQMTWAEMSGSLIDLPLGNGHFVDYNLFASAAPQVVNHPAFPSLAAAEWSIGTHPHNNYLGILRGHGIVGLLHFLTLVTLCIKRAYQRGAPDRLALLGMIIAPMIHGFVDATTVAVMTSAPFWLSSALLIMPQDFSLREEKNPRSSKRLRISVISAALAILAITVGYNFAKRQFVFEGLLAGGGETRSQLAGKVFAWDADFFRAQAEAAQDPVMRCQKLCEAYTRRPSAQYSLDLAQCRIQIGVAAELPPPCMDEAILRLERTLRSNTVKRTE